jgi:hypothetical protein
MHLLKMLPARVPLSESVQERKLMKKQGDGGERDTKNGNEGSSSKDTMTIAAADQRNIRTAMERKLHPLPGHIRIGPLGPTMDPPVAIVPPGHPAHNQADVIAQH